MGAKNKVTFFFEKYDKYIFVIDFKIKKFSKLQYLKQIYTIRVFILWFKVVINVFIHLWLFSSYLCVCIWPILLLSVCFILLKKKIMF